MPPKRPRQHVFRKRKDGDDWLDSIRKDVYARLKTATGQRITKEFLADAQRCHCAMQSTPMLTTAYQSEYASSYVDDAALLVWGWDQRTPEWQEVTDPDPDRADEVTRRNAAKSKRDRLVNATATNQATFAAFRNAQATLLGNEPKLNKRGRRKAAENYQQTIEETMQQTALGDNTDFAEKHRLLMGWGQARAYDVQPRTVYKQIETVHPWFFAYSDCSAIDCMTHEMWQEVLINFNAGYRNDHRFMLLDIIAHLQRCGVVPKEISCKQLFKDSCIPAKVVSMPPQQLLGPGEAEEAFFNLPDDQRWYLAFAYGGGLRSEECHLLPVSSVVVCTDDQLVIKVQRSKSTAGQRELPMHLTLPPALFPLVRDLCRRRRSEYPPTAPLLPRPAQFCQQPDKLSIEAIMAEISTLIPAIIATLHAICNRPVSFHDLRRTLSNCLVARLLELLYGEVIQPCAQPDNKASAWVPVPASSVHRIVCPDLSREIVRQQMTEQIAPLVRNLMGHANVATTYSTYFQAWIQLAAALIRYNQSEQ